jgi:hypothetical protein
MAITNPASVYTGKGKTRFKKFTFEPGTKLYHFSPHDSGIPGYERYMSLNIVFLANSKKHAEKILVDLCRWYIDNQYKNPTGTDNPEHILAHIDKWKIVPAPTNQFYKATWADNDTLF